MEAPLVLYDNYTRSLRAFAPLDADGPVGLYTCGPTVYDYPHIGNLRTYVFEDVLKRVLQWNGYARPARDERHRCRAPDLRRRHGEDKMEKGARRRRAPGRSPRSTPTAFVDDLAALNILAPDVCAAPPITSPSRSRSRRSRRRGYTYRTSDGVYFDTSRQADYG